MLAYMIGVRGELAAYDLLSYYDIEDAWMHRCSEKCVIPGAHDRAACALWLGTPKDVTAVGSESVREGTGKSAVWQHRTSGPRCQDERRVRCVARPAPHAPYLLAR